MGSNPVKMDFWECPDGNHVGNALLNPINHREEGEAGARGRIFRTKSGHLDRIQQFWLMSLVPIPWDTLFLGKQQFFLEKTEFSLENP